MTALARRLDLKALWIGVAVTLAACGGSSDDPPVPAPPPPNGAPGPVPPPVSGGTDPTVTLTAPAHLADGLNGSLQITADATDDSGVAGVEFQVDGETIGTEDTTAPYAITVNTADFASGQHVVRVRARDLANKVSAWSTATVRFGGTVATRAGFTKTENWVTGLTSATAMAQAPDGRLFVTQQTGQLRVVKNGALVAAPAVTLPHVDSRGERGLIGLAFHPQFASNGFVYLHYTTTDGGAHNRVSRFTVSGDIATAEQILIELPALSNATNHNGGALHFGLDGKLYVAVGDNANGSHAPSLQQVFGKVLRFNDDGTIPADNPFVASTSGQNESIWARGLRNPFTFGVQPGTGTLYINDVGENTWEEVNQGVAGANYGWPAAEGPSNVTGLVAPTFAYRQTPTVPPGSGPGGFLTGQSIVGAAFYPAAGNFAATYRGDYFFADFIGKYVARLDVDNGHAASTFALTAKSPVDVLAASDGALYVLNRDSIARIAITP